MKECEKCLPPCLQEQLVLHSHALCFTLFRSRQVSLCCCFKANQANADFDLSVRWFYTRLLQSTVVWMCVVMSCFGLIHSGVEV